MRTITVTVGPLAAASANNICLSQTPGAAGALTIAGALAASGVAKLDKPRRVLFTFAGQEATNSTVMTITGTDWNNNRATETVAGVNAGTAQTLYDYATVTSITVNKATNGALTVGTNGVASSRPINLDSWALPQVAYQVDISGTVNYSVQSSLNGITSGYTLMNWFDDPNFSGLAAAAQSSALISPNAVRLTLNSGTGTATLSVRQFGSVPQ